MATSPSGELVPEAVLPAMGRLTCSRWAVDAITASGFIKSEFQLKELDAASAFFLIRFCFFNGSFEIATSSSLFSFLAAAGRTWSNRPWNVLPSAFWNAATADGGDSYCTNAKPLLVPELLTGRCT